MRIRSDAEPDSFNQFTNAYGLLIDIRHLDADRVLARDRRDHAGPNGAFSARARSFDRSPDAL